ncbi:MULTISPECIES: 7-cyano-7-deazaguanine synthase [Cetobacterium]|jgi:tRNA-specific 2-thiouridylase|uniref:7-cyano-7-deazaguanine synthase n=1 Tax=Candidatus Cetobacterium colombiensis TaxID=3073100 RepID=A0ABU4WBS0_9FUSO|nr:7-cyano-7-deazaguanine synthase [Candidatus Cetobacterium colombiensis]MDX8335815.1 7-cyano-7-deazaguanine synthase [Candidatus Cetobacterium colombiensis]
MKALALFSGGLDSALAIKIVKDQGIEVIALNFVSHFFGGKNEKAENMAKQLGVQLEYVNFSSVHTEILKSPVHGRGKNMNPCIDCHALMFKTAGDLMEKFGASFIISGEVLGQRPMSQNYQALEKVKALSPGLENLIVRPLSAKLLPESEPEKLGWIDRSKLLDIQGRSRKTQMELMEKFGIVDYPTPGGGCLLTDPAYSKRLRILEEDGLLEDENSNLFHLLKIGRFFRFEKGKYLIVGREQDDNLKIDEFKTYGSLFIRGKEVPGPHMVGFGDLSQDEIEFSLNLFSRYSKVKGNSEITLLLNGNDKTIPAVDLEKLNEKIKQYQITM